MKVNKAYKFRFYPDKEQKENLAKTFGCARFVYNHMLKTRTDEYYNNGVKVNYNKTSELLTQLKKKKEYKWLNEVSAVPLQQGLRNLQKAFSNFWKKLTKYPKFKKKSHDQSITYADNAFEFKNNELTLAKQSGPLKIVWHREIPKNTRITSISVSKDNSDRYFVSLFLEEEVDFLPTNDNIVGIDLGLEDFVVFSSGEKVKAPKILKKYQNKLAILQKRLAKKQKESRRRDIARLNLAKMHKRIANKRSDFLHKLSTKIIRENQTIVVEDLNISGMLKLKKLSKSISDASWSEFLRQLKYKALWYGRNIIEIERWFPSSKRCNECGYILDNLKLDVRKWICPKCHVHHDRDINAAKNILTVGMTGIARGEDVRPACA